MKPEDTLETPGTIAILGAGPIGIEAALYGRYLGYQVTLFEAKEPCASLNENRMAPAPQHCTSPLGSAALAAQRTGRGGTTIEIEASTIGQWFDEYWAPLLNTDLLAGRIRSGVTVEALRLVPPEESDATEEADASDEVDASDEADMPSEEASRQDGAGESLYQEDEEEIPEDYLVVWRAEDGSEQSERFEAILDARGGNAAWIGPGDCIETAVALPPYLAWIGSRKDSNSDYLSGLADIREVFAVLSGRPHLDVYQNLGG